MLSPGSITNSVPDPDFVSRNIRDVQRTAQENASAQSLGQSQIGNGGTLTVAGALLVTGTISTPGILSSAGGLTATAGNVSAPAGNVSAGGQLSGASLAVTGAITGASLATTGDANVSGLLTADTGMSSLDAKTRVLTSGWSSLWIDGTGRIGQSGSARRYKQDIQPADIDTAAVLNLTPVQYRLKAAVKEFSDNARVEVGLIAEDLEPVAPWAVAYDAEGVVQGINYDRLTVALLAVVKSQSEQVSTLTARVTALEAR